jgi:hypothetical protein
MKRLVIALALAAFSLAPVGLRAQQSAPTPSPTPFDPHVYQDPAMHMRVPDTFYMMGYQPIKVDELDNTLKTVAAWRTVKGNTWVLTLAQESYDEPLDHWETAFENALRQQVDGVFISNKQRIALKNGMPAYFIGMTFGTGFDSRKQFALIWADGERGNALTMTGRVGEIGDDDAKKAFGDITAVQYPAMQP